MNRISPVVKNLLIINVLFFLATYIAGSSQGLNDPFGSSNTLIRHLALFYPKSPYFEPYQFVTHMFMHGGFMHILFNMYALWMFGTSIENAWGGKRFFVYYITTGLGAAGFYLLVQWLQVMHIEASIDANILAEMNHYLQNNSKQILETHMIPNSIPGMADWFQITSSSMLGASGAVFGVLLAFGMMFPNVRLMLLIPPMPVKAKWFVLAYGGIELFLGFSQSGSNIAHFAHVGGMLFGYILIKYWMAQAKKHG